jgi:3-(3-hydroxy-phenyl)propionate hydroxylase
MCAGIRDAFNLCWKLAGAVRGDYSEVLLDTYESERAPHVTAATHDAARIATAIQAGNAVATWLRDTYLRLRSQLPLLTRPMAREASWALGPGLFDEANIQASPPDQRNLFDQAVVETHHGEPEYIDNLLGPGFALLFFNYHPDQVMTPATRARWEQMGTRFVRVVPAGERLVSESDVRDPSGTLDRWRARVGGVDVAVIRPDRQVFGRYRGNPAALAGALERARKLLSGGLGRKARPDV